MSEKQELMKKFHALRMFEFIEVSPDIWMQKVPGGWVWSEHSKETGHSVAAVFVPDLAEYQDTLADAIYRGLQNASIHVHGL